MPITPDHSGNFPQEFEVCPDCGAKGVYWIRPSGVGANAISLWRCKYCKETFYVKPADVIALRQAWGNES